jgi:hypothetical protein
MLKSLLSLVLATAVLSSESLAATCVEINQESDQLGETEQQSALFLLKEGLLENGAVVEGECSSTWALTHLRLGGSITVSAVSSDRRLKLTVSSERDLPDIYSQMADAIVSNKDIEDSIRRDNVTMDQAHTQRVKADYMTIFSFGGTMYPPAGASVIPTFGTGLRVELDKWAIEVSGKLALPIYENNNFFAASGHLSALYFLNGTDNHSLYVGGGPGFSILAEGDSSTAEGAGFDGQLIGGYEMFRASNMRMFLQSNIEIPLYTIDGADSWSPKIGLNFGIGYRPQPNNNGGNVPWWALFL